jgi:hypothetical protein
LDDEDLGFATKEQKDGVSDAQPWAPRTDQS